jgi:hypothetical protein
MAEYEIDVLPEIKIVKVTISGHLDMESFRDISQKARVLSNKHQYHILCDLRKALPEMSAMQLSMMTKQNTELKAPEARNIKAVLICSEKKGLGKWQFLEYVEQASHLQTRVFTNFNEAVEWLSE